MRAVTREGVRLDTYNRHESDPICKCDNQAIYDDERVVVYPQGVSRSQQNLTETAHTRHQRRHHEHRVDTLKGRKRDREIDKKR